MKNKEKYVDDIIAIASSGYNIAVRRVYEQVVGCEATDCRDCVFLEGNCAENRQKWFESEAAPTIDELKSELETLKKERDELRARLEKAVELPYAPDSIDIGVTKMVQSVRDDSVELRTPIYIALKKDTLEEASAMLKELEQNAAERNDNADAIIYGLRTVIGALKADKNHDER